MTETTSRQPVEAHVVLAVRCRHHDRARPRLAEEDALEAPQARDIQVLDHLDDGRGVEPG